MSDRFVNCSNWGGSIDPYKGVMIRQEQAYSLYRMVEWFKKMIEVRGESNSELTAQYCDELMEALKYE